jgi:hypothetical protein
MLAALLLVAAAALGGCTQLAQLRQPTQPTPSPYAGTWQDRAGREAPDDHPGSEGFVLLSYDGSTHCDAQSVTFLAVAWPPGKVASSMHARTVRQYVRDPHHAYSQVPFRGEFAQDAALPSDARATGYHHGRYALWVSPTDADRHVYIQGPDGVERWPRPIEPIWCA